MRQKKTRLTSSRRMTPSSPCLSIVVAYISTNAASFLRQDEAIIGQHLPSDLPDTVT